MEYTYQEPSLFSFLTPLLNVALIVFVLTIIILPYFEAEQNGWLHSQYKTTLAEYCKEGNLPEPKEIKIVSLQRYRYEIRFYCFYDQSEHNQEIVIHKTVNHWRVYSKKNFRQEGSFYWPFYF